MLYSAILMAKNEDAGNEAILEVKKYIGQKEGQILEEKESAAEITSKKEKLRAKIVSFKIEIAPEEIEKVKKKISHEKEILSSLLEKKIISKKVEQKVKKPRVKKTEKKTSKKANKTKKVLASMAEEEKKIKDLDSTLDKILNE